MYSSEKRNTFWNFEPEFTTTFQSDADPIDS